MSLHLPDPRDMRLSIACPALLVALLGLCAIDASSGGRFEADGTDAVAVVDADPADPSDAADPTRAPAGTDESNDEESDDSRATPPGAAVVSGPAVAQPPSGFDPRAQRDLAPLDPSALAVALAHPPPRPPGARWTFPLGTDGPTRHRVAVLAPRPARAPPVVSTAV